MYRTIIDVRWQVLGRGLKFVRQDEKFGRIASLKYPMASLCSLEGSRTYTLSVLEVNQITVDRLAVSAYCKERT